MKANKPVSAKKKKATATTKKSAKTDAAKPKASAGKSVTTPKDLFSNQDNGVPDLNTSTSYPVHPKRIWPD
jgi:hypothetical protein